MKNTRKLFAILMAVTVIGLNYQPVAAARSDSCTSPDGYYCTYSLSVSGGNVYASLTASKSSGVLANPLTAEIDGVFTSDIYPGGHDFGNIVTQFDNGTYISCNASYTKYGDYVRSAAADYIINSVAIDCLYDF